MPAGISGFPAPEGITPARTCLTGVARANKHGKSIPQPPALLHKQPYQHPGDPPPPGWAAPTIFLWAFSVTTSTSYSMGGTVCTLSCRVKSRVPEVQSRWRFTTGEETTHEQSPPCFWAAISTARPYRDL